MGKWTCWLLVLCLTPSTSFATQYFNQIGWLEPDSQLHRLLQYPAVVEGIYRNNSSQMIWFDLQQSSKLEFQLEVIHHASLSTLFSRQLSYLQFYRKSNRWFEYDVLATDTLLLYLSYAESAKTKGSEWFFGRKVAYPLPLPPNSSLIATHRAIAQQSLGDLIDRYTPDSAGYQYLIDTYLHLIKFQKLNMPLYEQVGIKTIGDKLNNRDVLLQRLEVVDVNILDVRKDVTWFDSTLETAIKQFQRLHGLAEDGVIGPATIAWLNLSIEKRLSILAINAERIRYWPVQRETIIVVNVPSFEMKYWSAGEQVFASKVVVGRKGRPTPVMNTNLDSLILNPTWNVPWKIMVEDIIPKVKEDIDYLTRQNIKIVPKWGSEDIVNPEEIDWENLRPSSFPYRMTQLSGNANALGLYKFNTPNRRAIYLHDTPSKGLFDETQRAFSSGCIRVENADLFAVTLLETQGLELEEDANSEESEPVPPVPNQAIPLKSHIPVHIIYQTAWYEEGNVHYREDIYRLDRFRYTKG
ncbi:MULTISPECIES: L,D-transpeptidase family protein [Vibrio]|uniref:Peptidase n=1 Tax=Vibrio bivalvicida TaxID=1276888 RepID=A0A177XTS2_9VIBR|nr:MULTISPECIES: L,D-transpeptidase family protein [Vibrio]KLN64809.1 peptidase [Vibrio sp. VPAP30]OAJ91990.1 peptidase [Vibrio bivalvicida]